MPGRLRFFVAWAAIAAWLAASGLTWDLLQVAAWVNMSAANARMMTVGAAVAKTLADEACPMCKAAAAGRAQSERSPLAPQDAVKAKLEVAQAALPKGVNLIPAYDRAELVQKALKTAESSLVEGAILVAVILFLFLGEFRSAIVVIVTLPLAMLIAFIGLIALLNAIIGQLGGVAGLPDLSIQLLLGYLFAPLAFLIGVPWEAATTAGSFIGQKLVTNEFVAFVKDMDYRLQKKSTIESEFRELKKHYTWFSERHSDDVLEIQTKIGITPLPFDFDSKPDEEDIPVPTENLDPRHVFGPEKKRPGFGKSLGRKKFKKSFWTKR